jgi:lipid II:glycine glycyltransferase (peptidoglycan interpeptide bridge formation enzyme)
MQQIRAILFKSAQANIMLRMSAQVSNIDDALKWDEFLGVHNGHLLQTYEWGSLKSEYGWRAYRIGVESEGTLVAAAQMLVRRVPLLTFAYVPRGPTFAYSDQESVNILTAALIDASRQENAMVLKIEPNLIEANGMVASMLQAGFVHNTDTIQPRTTIHLDLASDAKLLLDGMKPKWRYNIRLAERKGVKTRPAQPNEFPSIYELLRLTGKRDRFAVHSSEYYERAMQLLGDKACWLVAEFEREILAAIFVTANAGEAIYLYGASGNEHRDKMPNHALHWAAIQWAKQRGCFHYDLWGIPDNAEPTAGDLPEGLYRFKQGFGGRSVRYVGSFDYVLRPTVYKLYTRLIRSRRGPGIG